MPKPPSSWKAFELWVCRWWPQGQRRGADYGDEYVDGKNDCVHTPGFSVEVKFGKQMGYRKMVNACIQAEKAAEQNELPIAIVKQSGADREDTLVVMRQQTFREWFI